MINKGERLPYPEDLCNENISGNASSLSPAPLADDRDAAAAAAAEIPLAKV